MLFHHLAFFCMKEPETSIHLFHTFTKANILWSQLQLSLQHCVESVRIPSYSGPYFSVFSHHLRHIAPSSVLSTMQQISS